MKSWKLLMAVLLGVGLVVGLAVPALARPQNKVGPAAVERAFAQMQRGKVTQVNAGNLSFVIQPQQRPFRASDNATPPATPQPVTITTDANTKFYKVELPGVGLPQVGMMFRGNARGFVPGNLKGLAKGFAGRQGTQQPPQPQQPQQNGRFGQPATFGDITVGADVVVWLADNNSSLAKQVIILEQVYARVSGNITALDTAAKTIQITPTGGTAVTVNYNDQTIFTLRGTPTLAVGQTVHVVYQIKDNIARSVNMPPAVTPRANTAQNNQT